MVIDFFNINGGGSGGTVDYATSANTSNKTKLLEGVSSLPLNANEGDVVAGANAPTRGGAKSRSAGIETALYQYTNGEWQKVELGGEIEATSFLKAQSEMPEGVGVGDVFTSSAQSFSYSAAPFSSFTRSSGVSETWESDSPQAVAFFYYFNAYKDIEVVLNKNGETFKSFTIYEGTGTIFDEENYDFLVYNEDHTEVRIMDGDKVVAIGYIVPEDMLFYLFITDSNYAFYSLSNTLHYMWYGEVDFTSSIEAHTYQVVDDGEGGLTTVEIATKNDIPSGSTYELPIASSQTLGGVKVGNNLTIDSAGTLSTSGLVVGSGITTIAKIYQSDYDSLVSGGTADASTLYVVLPDPIPVIVVTNMSPNTYGSKDVSFFGGNLWAEISNDGSTDSLTSGNTTGDAYNISYNNGVVTFEGAFSGTMAVHMNEIGGANQGPCDNCETDSNITISGYTTEVAFSVSCTTDQECDCYENSGCWDSENQTCYYSGDQGYDECDCVAQGGTWDGNECQYGGGSSDPDYCDSESPDYNPDACNCVSDGGEWVEVYEGHFVCSGNTNPECNAAGSDYNSDACECIHNGGTWIEGEDPSDSYCEYGGGEPDYCDSESPDYDPTACDCLSNGGIWTDDGEGGYFCDCQNGEEYDNECSCVTNGGTWYHNEDSGDYECDYECGGDGECLNCIQNGGSWEDDGEGNYSCNCGGDPACECAVAGGSWDDMMQYCDCNSDPECDCVANGGEWVVPEIGDPYCNYGTPSYCDSDDSEYNQEACDCVTAGGEWEGMMDYCECNGDVDCDCAVGNLGPDECECYENGGTWDDTLNDGAGGCVMPV